MVATGDTFESPWGIRNSPERIITGVHNKRWIQTQSAKVLIQFTGSHQTIIYESKKSQFLTIFQQPEFQVTSLFGRG